MRMRGGLGNVLKPELFRYPWGPCWHADADSLGLGGGRKIPPAL